MTVTEFVRKIAEVARQQARPVHFEPDKDGITLQFVWKEFSDVRAR